MRKKYQPKAAKHIGVLQGLKPVVTLGETTSVKKIQTHFWVVTQRSPKTAAKGIDCNQSVCQRVYRKLQGFGFIELYYLGDYYWQIFISIDISLEIKI